MKRKAYICDMGRQLSHLLGAMLLSMVLWLSLLNPSRADHFVDSLAGPQHEYKIVLGAALLATNSRYVKCHRDAPWSEIIHPVIPTWLESSKG
jgi:hypothetical protein